jgi:hypothetical protein
MRVLAFLLALMLAEAATGQTQTAPPAGRGNPGPERPAGLLNQDYLTSTGETMPRPGVPQGVPTSPLDRRIEEENSRIDQGICSNCR